MKKIINADKLPREVRREIARELKRRERLKAKTKNIKGVKKNKKGSKKRYTSKPFSKKIRNGLIIAGALFVLGITPDKEIDLNNIYTTQIEETTDTYNKKGELDKKLVIGNDGQKNAAIFLKKPTKDDELYKAIVITDEGDLKEVYIKGKDIPKETIQEIQDFYNEDAAIGIVSAPSGAYARPNKLVDKTTEEAKLLNPETYVLCGVPETSSENAYTWKKILYFDENENAHFAYMAEDYLIDIEKLDENKEFKVSTETLKLRQTPSVENGEIIKVLDNDESVFRVPNINEKSDERYDWVYVAYKNTENDKVELGWVAQNDKKLQINYIQEVPQKDLNKGAKEEKVEFTDDKSIIKIVDTSSVDYTELKLRKKPGTKSDILFKLENGTELYVTEKDMEKSEKTRKIDGFRWVKVTLQDGTEGYVAREYLAEPKEKVKEGTREIEYRNLKVFNEGTIKGCVGIDLVPENVGIGNLEQILKGNIGISINSELGTIEGKPEFVYIKLGATGWGDKFCIVGKDSKTDIESVEERIKINQAAIRMCEKYGIPWGAYYYSQATNEKETKAEIDYIKKVYNGLGELNYQALPFAIDIEELQGRMAKFSNKSNTNKEYLTELKQDMMEDVKKILGQDTIIYSDKNALTTIVDYTKLSEDSRVNMWVANPNQKHSDGLRTLGLTKDISIRQIRLDTAISPNKQNIHVDINYINQDFFEKCLEEKGIEYAFVSRDKNQREIGE